MFQMKVGLELPNLVKKFQSVLKMKDRLNFHEVECNLPPPPPPPPPTTTPASPVLLAFTWHSRVTESAIFCAVITSFKNELISRKN